MVIKYGLLASVIAAALSVNAGELVISEIFLGVADKPNSQWLELYNPGDTPVPLAGAKFYRADGKAQELAWSTVLAGNIQIAPKGFGLLAQQADLGAEIKLSAPVLVLDPNVFTLKTTGTQMLCIELLTGESNCVPFSKAQFQKGHSLETNTLNKIDNDNAANWHAALCRMGPDYYATPGAPPGDCSSAQGGSLTELTFIAKSRDPNGMSFEVGSIWVPASQALEGISPAYPQLPTGSYDVFGYSEGNAKSFHVASLTVQEPESPAPPKLDLQVHQEAKGVSVQWKLSKSSDAVMQLFFEDKNGKRTPFFTGIDVLTHPSGRISIPGGTAELKQGQELVGVISAAQIEKTAVLAN